MKKFTKRVALLVAAVLFITLSACGGGAKEVSPGTSQASADTQTKDASQTGTEQTREPITVTWLANIGASDVTTAIQDNPVFKEIAEKTGVTWDFSPNLGVTDVNEKCGILLASGDLPDLITTGYAPNISKIIKAKAAIPLDELISKYGQNILENCKEALAVSKLLRSGDTKTLYFIPDNTSKGGFTDPIYPRSYYVRWDLYKKLGTPKINTEDDFLKILADMQKLEPTTSDGKKTYAFGLGLTDQYSHAFAEWPGCALNGLYFATWESEVDILNNVMVPRYSPDSVFLKQLRFYNKAYRMGLMDPDTATMSGQAVNEKVLAGRYLALPGWGNAGADAAFVSAGTPEKGYVPVRVEDSINKQGMNLTDAFDGGGWLSTCITTACKNPERVVQMIDFLCTPEGAVLQKYGIEGKHWEIKDGQGVIKDEVLEGIRNDPDYYKKEGMAYAGGWGSLCFMSPTGREIKGVNATFEMNPAVVERQMTAVQKDYCTTMGFKTPADLYADIPVKVYDPWACNIMTLPDELNAKETKIVSYLDANMVKLLFAKSDADFDAARDKLIADIKAMGLDECDNYHKNDFDNAKKNLDEILKTMK